MTPVQSGLLMFRGTVRVVHFVGIGGIGMSGIAEVLLNLGFQVTGSDLRQGKSVRRLEKLGATVHIGHRTENVGEADVVVRSTAVGEDNVEVAAALHQGIPVIRRAEMLAELMRLKHGIAIAGSHGKTTTTSMVALILAEAGLDPTVVVGGVLDQLKGTNAKLGQGTYMVAEADESDGTFSMLSPTVAAITNIDPEHMDHYETEAALEDAFVGFANKVPFYGFAVVCVDHPTVLRLRPRFRRRVVSYGFGRHADLRGTDVEHEGSRVSFTVNWHGVALGRVRLGMPGDHNAANAMAAIAIALELQVPFDVVQRALEGFTGVQRRFTVRGEVDEITVVDDYGHHPVEITATLRAAAEGYPKRRILAVFQPHRFSRLDHLFDDFCGAFSDADHVLVVPVYTAGESKDDRRDHHDVAEALVARGHRGTVELASLAEATAWLDAHAQAGDVVVTLGAGDVHTVCADFLDARGGAA